MKFPYCGKFQNIFSILWKIGVLALLSLATWGYAEPVKPSPRILFKQGMADFNASNYPAAMTAFQQAAQQASDQPDQKLDPSTAYYNAAVAAALANETGLADSSFAKATQRGGSDVSMQAEAYYNRGNLLYRQADDISGTELPGGISVSMPTSNANTHAPDASKLIDEAISMYENAVLLNPKDSDAKANYELALIKKQEILEQQQQQQSQQDQRKDQQEEQQEQEPSQGQDSQSQEREDQQQPQEKEQPQPQSAEAEQNEASDENQDEQDQQQMQTQPADAEEMSSDEAEQLLDAMKQQEQSQRDRLQIRSQPIPVEKDW